VGVYLRELGCQRFRGSEHSSKQLHPLAPLLRFLTLHQILEGIGISVSVRIHNSGITYFIVFTWKLGCREIRSSGQCTQSSYLSDYGVGLLV
jgi:hypothetical protein